jgi:hypothetical protein
MTDETTGPVETTEAQTEELDPRVSTPDDGFPLFDAEDSTAVQAQLDSDDPDGFNPGVADYESEH